MDFRWATVDDVTLLAAMNQQLQIDENHRLRMSLAELEPRMLGWITNGGYRAVLFGEAAHSVGYALYRREPDHFYLKQFFVRRDARRQGVGRTAIAWLRQNAWADLPHVYLDALVVNPDGIAFWHAVGFRDYCITMEMHTTPS